MSDQEKNTELKASFFNTIKPAAHPKLIDQYQPLRGANPERDETWSDVHDAVMSNVFHQLRLHGERHSDIGIKFESPYSYVATVGVVPERIALFALRAFEEWLDRNYPRFAELERQLAVYEDAIKSLAHPSDPHFGDPQATVAALNRLRKGDQDHMRKLVSDVHEVERQLADERGARERLEAVLADNFGAGWYSPSGDKWELDPLSDGTTITYGLWVNEKEKVGEYPTALEAIDGYYARLAAQHPTGAEE